MSKITLGGVPNLIDSVTAATTINSNSSIIQTAWDNNLSRDGTTPNEMNAPLDMNSFQILNLPAPTTAVSPLRLQDLNDFLGGALNLFPGGTLVNIQFFTSNGTYTRSANVHNCLAFLVGGGGGGAGADANASEVAVGGSAGAGGWSVGWFAPSATETVTIGFGGLGSAVGNSVGTSGTASSIGTHMTATGGTAGSPSNSGAVRSILGGAGGTGSGGQLNGVGGTGAPGFGSFAASFVVSGNGGSSGGPLGTPGGCGVVRTSLGGVAGQSVSSGTSSYGGGGSGAVSFSNSGAVGGGTGSSGAAMILEFV